MKKSLPFLSPFLLMIFPVVIFLSATLIFKPNTSAKDFATIDIKNNRLANTSHIAIVKQLLKK
ncbi:hypothetical protein [Pedobacter cryophilus]|uniref:Uncharacterized protein n=1 Tax=Pedobacter cryophilus TaxID=2571271 RepID=A0A4V5P125_9SPHI|nr:hypothetical protein [Pedobacter cryophilus]TKC00671.1 hypothetical protein FA046_03045 [Pedobacter cryophilus]